MAQTSDERRATYMKFKKSELVDMLIRCQSLLEYWMDDRIMKPPQYGSNADLGSNIGNANNVCRVPYNPFPFTPTPTYYPTAITTGLEYPRDLPKADDDSGITARYTDRAKAVLKSFCD